MLIDGTTIRHHICRGDWKVLRWENGSERKLLADELKIGPNSVDVTLGDKFLSPRMPAHLNGPVDPVDPERRPEWVEVEPKDGKILLLPGTFLLGTVRERFICPWAEIDLLFEDVDQPDTARFPVAQMLEGRSTIARLGVATHVTAGFGDVGFSGNFTLEIVNQGPLDLFLTVGMRIAQISFAAVTQGLFSTDYDHGAYAENHIGRPIPPVLGKERFMV